MSVSWKDETGVSGDPNGSGVRYYDLISPGLHNGPVMETGGLTATCFLDTDLKEEGLTYVEESMDLMIHFRQVSTQASILRLAETGL